MKNKKDKIYKIVISVLLVIIILLLVIILLVVLNNKEKNNNYTNYNSNGNVINDDEIYDDTTVKISMQRALEIALNDLKIKQNNISDIDIDIDNRYGNIVYEVSFNYNMHEYEYYIDVNSGKIIYSFKELDI